MKNNKNFLNIFLFSAILFLSANFSEAAVQGELINFNVDNSFDSLGRTQVQGELIRISGNLYFYVEKSWWDSQSSVKKSEIISNFDLLSKEFSDKIYPQITLAFGTEWDPGIDKDRRITVFFHLMNSNEGGYFREADEYEKVQIPISNQREMVYISADLAGNFNLAKIALAHEFTHLVSFNQKNKIFGLSEETWLDELRADYSSRIVGYDKDYEGSNLQQRVSSFIENPSDSLTEWRGNKYDYAVANLFANYLVDHYGISILTDSLHSPYKGIASINYALKKNDFNDDFNEVFTNWVIASALNDCSLGKQYCYLDSNLKNFRVVPNINFLPLTGNVSLSVNNFTKNWTGNWLKFIGGSGDLNFDFSGAKSINFEVPYFITDKNGNNSINFVKLDANKKGGINILNFGSNYKSLVIMPFIYSLSYEAEYLEPIYPYNYTVSVQGQKQVEQEDGEQALIRQLLDRIAYLKALIADLEQGKTQGAQCGRIEKDLFYGMTNNVDVRCLQQFLKSQNSNIYPEGLVTGNFLGLTKEAVTRFQEKYSSDILAPLGLTKGTGYVGSSTRAKINQIIQGT